MAFTSIQYNEADYLNVRDIEFDKYNFQPGCAMVIRGVSTDDGNNDMYVYGYEVPCPGQQPCQGAQPS